MPKKPQELSPIYKEILDFKKVKKMIKKFLFAAETHPDFQDVWQDTVRKQFEKGVLKYGKTLDENETKTFGGWYAEGLEEMVDFAAYNTKGEKTYNKSKKIKTK